jgi:hypothetical protein
MGHERRLDRPAALSAIRLTAETIALLKMLGPVVSYFKGASAGILWSSSPRRRGSMVGNINEFAIKDCGCCRMDPRFRGDDGEM